MGLNSSPYEKSHWKNSKT